MAETIRVTGLREVQRKLYSYSQQIGDRVVLGALRQGAHLVKRAAQSNAPIGETGKLRRGIRVYKSKIHKGTKSGDMIGVYISVASKKKGDPFYGRFQEDGWKAGKRQVPGKKFIDRAFIEKRAAAVDLIVRSANAGADLLARKMGL